jgi:hypothetical protein
MADGAHRAAVRSQEGWTAALTQNPADADYLGVCCGAGAHHIRALAAALGRAPPASRYSPDMSKHYVFGSLAGLRERNTRYADELRGRERAPSGPAT